MLLWLNKNNFDEYRSHLVEMYRTRHKVFVDIMGWLAIRKPHQMDADDYDHLEANYILLLDDETGVLEGGVRLIETKHPHYLGDKARSFIDEKRYAEIVRGRVFESSRMFTSPHLVSVAAERNRVADTLYSGILEFGEKHGTDLFITLVDVEWYQHVKSKGSDCKAIGLPQPYDEGSAVALLIRMQAKQIPVRFPLVTELDPAFPDLNV